MAVIFVIVPQNQIYKLQKNELTMELINAVCGMWRRFNLWFKITLGYLSMI